MNENQVEEKLTEKQQFAINAANPQYRATHDPDGHMLGSRKYPNNREGRRALARTWRGFGKL